MCKTSSTSHLASTYGPVEEESFRINFQVYQRRLCTVRLLGDNRNADVKKLQTQNKGPRREKKHNVQLKTGASVYYNVGLTFYRFGLEFDGVLCWNIITTHSELRSQTLALCHCLLVKKFKSFKKLNYPQGKDL